MGAGDFTVCGTERSSEQETRIAAASQKQKPNRKHLSYLSISTSKGDRTDGAVARKVEFR